MAKIFFTGYILVYYQLYKRMISPIYPKQIYYSRPVKRNNSPSFTAHPELDKLAEHFSVTASSYFRRGQYYGAPADEFIDVENILKSVFKHRPNNQKNMLIVGIGSSQEPFSYLAVIKNAIKGRDLRKSLNMQIVDMQSKPDSRSLFVNSFFDSPRYPMYAGQSFIYDIRNRGLFEKCHYRVKDDIFKFVQETYDNPNKAKWDTRIQDVAKDYPSEKFDIISANNVLPYISNHTTIIDTIHELKRSLKPGGYFITDPFKFPYMYEYEVQKNLREVKDGIYQKIK